MSKRRIIAVVLPLIFLLIPVEMAVQSALDYPTYLPYVSVPVPTPSPTPSMNAVCATSGAARICARVSAMNPPQNGEERVYGYLTVNNVGQPNLEMKTTWHYQSATLACSAFTDEGGFALCSQTIGQQPSGYQVNVDVSIGGYKVTTWFTPQ